MKAIYELLRTQQAVTTSTANAPPFVRMAELKERKMCCFQNEVSYGETKPLLWTNLKSHTHQQVCPGEPCDSEARGQCSGPRGPRSSSSWSLQRPFSGTPHRSSLPRRAFRPRCSSRPANEKKKCEVGFDSAQVCTSQ